MPYVLGTFVACADRNDDHGLMKRMNLLDLIIGNIYRIVALSQRAILILDLINVYGWEPAGGGAGRPGHFPKRDDRRRARVEMQVLLMPVQIWIGRRAIVTAEQILLSTVSDNHPVTLSAEAVIFAKGFLRSSRLLIRVSHQLVICRNIDELLLGFR